MAGFDLALGIDFGTSGVRAAVVDRQRQPLWSHRLDYPSLADLAEGWRVALFQVLAALPADLALRLGRIGLDGTSGTVLLCDRAGTPLTPPLLYNDARGQAVLEHLRAIAPANHLTLSATSSLAKLLWWQHTLDPATWQRAAYLLHQADWLGAQLHGQWGISDYHNSLKLGYDVGHLTYPGWMRHQAWSTLLPQVLAPGAVVGPITAAIAQRFGLSPQCQVVAGTTDSIAAFLASGARVPGDGVTSLGSTLVIKLLSRARVDASQYGIYSHRLGDLWLAGGASNSGGAVLRRFFDDQALADLSQTLDPTQATGLNYYPLLRLGERFPINDPNWPPRLTPRPADDRLFLHGLLEGIARIEQRGYQRLATLGATPLQQVYTAGGGAKNDVWTKLRSHLMQIPIETAASTEAAVGVASLGLNHL